MELNPSILIQGVMIVFAAGGAWVGVKSAFNGMKEDMKEIKENAKHTRQVLENHEGSITIIETQHALERE